MAATGLPRLKLIRQNCAAQEKISKNGLPKIAYVVIKNSPFMVVIGQEAAPGSPPFDFNGFAVECTLLYDTEPTKMVDFVRSKPVEYKATAVERGTLLQIEMRIKVLTSQHEDMFFRVHVQVTDAETKQPIQGLAVRTEPIKVISKPEQLKRRRPQPIQPEGGTEPRAKSTHIIPRRQTQPQQPSPQRMVATVTAAAAAALPARPPPPSPLPQLQVQPAQLPPQLPSQLLPRLGDILDVELQSSTQPQQQSPQALPPVTQMTETSPELDAVALALDVPLAMPPSTPAQPPQQQQTGTQGRTLIDLFAETLTRIEQRQLLQQHLLEEVHSSSNAKGLAFSWNSDSDTKPDFVTAFAALMNAYGRLGQTERAANVRRVMQLATPTQVSQMSELVDMFATEGLGRELGHEARPPCTFTPSSQQPGEGGLCCDDMAGLDLLGTGYQSYTSTAM